MSNHKDLEHYRNNMHQEINIKDIKDIKFIRIRSGEYCKLIDVSGDMLAYKHPKEGTVYLHNGKMFNDRESPIDLVSYCTAKDYPELYL